MVNDEDLNMAELGVNCFKSNLPRSAIRPSGKRYQSQHALCGRTDAGHNGRAEPHIRCRLGAQGSPLLLEPECPYVGDRRLFPAQQRAVLGFMVVNGHKQTATVSDSECASRRWLNGWAIGPPVVRVNGGK